jgi:DNA-binding beta-propeller fold protein YncE
VDLIIGSIDVTGSRLGKFKKVLFGEEGEMGFIKPVFCAARDNILYVTDLTGILVFDFNEKKFSVIGTKFLLNPTGIAVAADGRVFVADSAKKKVYVLQPKSKLIKPFVKDTFGNPGGITVDNNNGRVIVADVKNHVVNVYSLDGDTLFSFGWRGRGPGELNFPYDVAVDSEGRIYVVDSGNFRVQIFDKEGNYLSMFGSVGTLPGQFARPKGIALDPDGHIYVVDAAFGNVQIFTEKGQILLAVGVVGIEPGQFVLPIGIAFDVDGKLYVVDQLNKRVQMFQYITYPDEQT